LDRGLGDHHRAEHRLLRLEVLRGHDARCCSVRCQLLLFRAGIHSGGQPESARMDKGLTKSDLPRGGRRFVWRMENESHPGPDRHTVPRISRLFLWRYFASATIVFTEAVTPPPTSTSTMKVPVSRIGSSSRIFLRSTLIPRAAWTASAISAEVTEPKSLPSSPAR